MNAPAISMTGARHPGLIDGVRSCLSRAAGQKGRAEIGIELETIDGETGNAATLFDLHWEVHNGHLYLHLMIDGVEWAELTV